MEYLRSLLDIILHLDTHLAQFLLDHGAWTYLILVLILFCETGLVITPFLPGDSLLFAAGALAGLGSLNIFVLIVTLISAAVIGDMVNYVIGKTLGQHALSTGKLFGININRAHLVAAQEFHVNHGRQAIFLARFVPMMRTLMPFIAGMSRMPYPFFASANITGGIIWVSLFLGLGYFFGGMEIVKQHFSLVILAIIFLSLIPVLIEFIKSRRK